MATPNYQEFLELPPDDLTLGVVSLKRVYQTSNIIIQDKNKDGILSFLSDTTRYGNSNVDEEQASTPLMTQNPEINQQTSQMSTTGTQSSNTGGY